MGTGMNFFKLQCGFIVTVIEKVVLIPIYSTLKRTCDQCRPKPFFGKIGKIWSFRQEKLFSKSKVYR